MTLTQALDVWNKFVEEEKMTTYFHLNCSKQTSDEVEECPEVVEIANGLVKCEACGLSFHPDNLVDTYPEKEGVFYSLESARPEGHIEEFARKEAA